MKHYYVFVSGELLIQREYGFVTTLTTFICHDTFPEEKHIQIACDATLCVWKGERIVGGKQVPENYLHYFDFCFLEERLDNLLKDLNVLFQYFQLYILFLKFEDYAKHVYSCNSYKYVI